MRWILLFWWERNVVCVIEDAYRWWHQEEKLCISKISSLVEKLCTLKISSLVEKLCPTVMLWYDIKIRIDTLDPCLQGCYWWWMASRIETLHSGHLYLSQETLSDCHVSQKTAVLMMMHSSVNEREMKLLHWRCSESCFDVTSRSETTHLTRVSRLAPDDDIKKINSIYRLVRKLCSTVMLVRKLMC